MKKLCNNGDFFIVNEMYLHNNLWGENNGFGTQCSWIRSFDKNNINWKTDWNWTGNNSSIKSYASIVYGWHWGWKVKKTELPFLIDEIKRIKTSWEFNVVERNNNNLNITYDIWLSNRITDRDNPDGEIMIWLFKNGEVPPIGEKKKDIELFNTKWALWEGLHPDHKWPVFSFIRKENIDKVDFDISKFINEIRNENNFTFKFLLSVQAGIEVLSGIGSFESTKYRIEIE